MTTVEQKEGSLMIEFYDSATKDLYYAFRNVYNLKKGIQKTLADGDSTLPMHSVVPTTIEMTINSFQMSPIYQCADIVMACAPKLQHLKFTARIDVSTASFPQSESESDDSDGNQSRMKRKAKKSFSFDEKNAEMKASLDRFLEKFVGRLSQFKCLQSLTIDCRYYPMNANNCIRYTSFCDVIDSQLLSDIDAFPSLNSICVAFNGDSDGDDGYHISTTIANYITFLRCHHSKLTSVAFTYLPDTQSYPFPIAFLTAISSLLRPNIQNFYVYFPEVGRSRRDNNGVGDNSIRSDEETAIVDILAPLAAIFNGNPRLYEFSMAIHQTSAPMLHRFFAMLSQCQCVRYLNEFTFSCKSILETDKCDYMNGLMQFVSSAQNLSELTMPQLSFGQIGRCTVQFSPFMDAVTQNTHIYHLQIGNVFFNELSANSVLDFLLKKPYFDKCVLRFGIPPLQCGTDPKKNEITTFLLQSMVERLSKYPSMYASYRDEVLSAMLEATDTTKQRKKGNHQFSALSMWCDEYILKIIIAYAFSERCVIRLLIDGSRKIDYSYHNSREIRNEHGDFTYGDRSERY